MRADHDAVRSVFENFGLPAVRAWQSLPYVEIESDERDGQARTHEARKRNDVLGEETFPMPWDAFVIGVTLDTATSTNLSIHVSRKFPNWLRAYLREEDTRKPPILNPEVYLAVPIPHSTVLVLGLGRKENGTPGTVLFTSSPVPPTDKEATSELNSFGITIANVVERTVLTVNQSSGHLTEITAASPRCTSKTIKLKPWVRDDLSRIILLDPSSAAKRYGMPTGKTVTERHAPVPHGRRGHWRRLSDERRTWVRPAWIGPLQWESSGQIYRVLTRAI